MFFDATTPDMNFAKCAARVPKAPQGPPPQTTPFLAVLPTFPAQGAKGPRCHGVPHSMDFGVIVL